MGASLHPSGLETAQAEFDFAATGTAVRGALGEHLDHPTDGVGTVQTAHRPGHHLDAFDLAHRDVLEGAGAGGGGLQAHAVDQHQGLIGIGAAQENRGGLAGTAGRRHLDPAELTQHLAQCHRAAGLEFARTDHARRRQAVRQRLDHAIGRHHRLGTLCDRQFLGRIVGRGGRGAAIAGVRGQAQAEASQQAQQGGAAMPRKFRVGRQHGRLPRRV